jgi:hypothetical protein
VQNWGFWGFTIFGKGWRRHRSWEVLGKQMCCVGNAASDDRGHGTRTRTRISLHLDRSYTVIPLTMLCYIPA